MPRHGLAFPRHERLESEAPAQGIEELVRLREEAPVDDLTFLLWEWRLLDDSIFSRAFAPDESP